MIYLFEPDGAVRPRHARCYNGLCFAVLRLIGLVRVAILRAAFKGALLPPLLVHIFIFLIALAILLGPLSRFSVLLRPSLRLILLLVSHDSP